MSGLMAPHNEDGELPVSADTDDLLSAEHRTIARRLSSPTVRVGPSAGFVDRVMAAVEAAPTPTPARAFIGAVAGGSLRDALGALVLAWRFAARPRPWVPLAARAQAVAFLLVVVVAATGVAAGGLAGAVRVLGPDTWFPPGPTEAPGPTVGPAEIQTPAPESPAPSDSVEPEETSAGTGEPGETPEGTAETVSTPSPEGSPGTTTAPSSTPAESDGPDETATPSPPLTATPKPSETPEPSGTPQSSPTPRPSATPQAESTSSGSDD